MFEEVKEMIDSTIYTNGRGEVTAQNINLAMHGMVDATEDKFGEVDDAVKAVEDKVTALEENGTGGGGPLRVWINGGDGGENNSEMIAENAATFKAMWSEKPQQVILCDTLELDGYQIKGAYPVAGYYLTSEEGTNAILMTYPEVVNGEDGLELIETVVNLFEDGTVTVTIA